MAATSQATVGPARPTACGLCRACLTNARWQSNLAWGSAPAAEKVDLPEIWRKLWRGKRMITMVTIAGSLLGYASFSSCRRATRHRVR